MAIQAVGGEEKSRWLETSLSAREAGRGFTVKLEALPVAAVNRTPTGKPAPLNRRPASRTPRTARRTAGGMLCAAFGGQNFSLIWEEPLGKLLPRPEEGSRKGVEGVHDFLFLAAFNASFGNGFGQRLGWKRLAPVILHPACLSWPCSAWRVSPAVTERPRE